MQAKIPRERVLSALALSLLWVNVAWCAPQPVTVTVLDTDGRRLPARIHCYNSQGQPQKADSLPNWNDHFVCPGEATLRLKPGSYRYEVERGPEYSRESGDLQVEPDGDAEIRVTLRRLANLRNAGWYSADLHVHRSLSDIELLMRAEDLDFAPVITWWNKTNLWRRRDLPASVLRRFDQGRIYHLMAGEDERGGGALLYFGLQKPLKIDHAEREFPSPLRFVNDARERDPNVWIDVEKPFWWDVPVWLARGNVNSVGLANNHMNRSGMYADEAWGRPRDTQRLPAPRGNGFWTQEIYYQILNAGLRIPPSAGSASGVLPNPVGYNRVYVQLDKPFTHARWWQALARGNCFVTNGPLLLCRAGGKLPGAVFQSDGEAVKLRVEVELTSLDPVSAIEIVKNGRVVKRVACSPATSQRLDFDVDFAESGWFLVRAVADLPHTFRFASTGPFYVETGQDRRRISKASVQFFVDWVDERAASLAQLTEAAQRESVLSGHRLAREFWLDRLQHANQP